MIVNVDIVVPVQSMTDAQLSQLAGEVADEQRRRAPAPVLLTGSEKCLALGGFTIEAIKHARERIGRETGVKPGLRQVKDAIDACRRAAGWTESSDGILRAP